MSSTEAPVSTQPEPTTTAQEETVAPTTEATETAPAAAAAEEAPAAPTESTIAIIEQGYVFKRGPAPLRLWQKRLFVLPAEGRPSYSLNNLRQVYRKNVKKTGAPKEEFTKANEYLLHTLATATVNASYILAYYKNDSSKEIPNGLINLSLATSVIAAPKIRPNAFVIKTKARDYVLSATTPSETESWIRTLNEFVNAELPDFSDSEAYKQSYNELASRQVYVKKATPSNSTSVVAVEEEPFSASEAEFEPETTTSPTAEEPAAETPAEEPAATEAPAEPASPPRAKTLYNNVVNFLTRKDKEVTPQSSTTQAAEAATEAAPEAEAPAAEEAAAAAVAETAEEATEATEDKVEAAEETVEAAAEEATEAPAEAATEAPAAENKPSRVKSFFSKEHNGLFKFFNKKTGETTVVKGPIENHEAHPDGELVPITHEEAQEVEAANATSTEAEAATEEAAEAPAAEAAAEEPKAEEVKPKEAKTPLLQRIVSFGKVKSEPTSPAQAAEKSPSTTASPVPEPIAEVAAAAEEPVAETVAVAAEEPAAATEAAEATPAPVESSEAEAEAPAAETERSADAQAEDAPAASSEPHESSLQRAMSMILKGFHHEKKADGEAAATEEPAAAEAETTEAAAVTEEPVSEEPAAETEQKEVDADADAEASPSSPQRKPSMFARLGEYAYNAVSGTGTEAEVDESTPSPLADKIEASAKHGALLKQGYVLRSLETRYFILGTDGVLRYYHSHRDAGEGKKIELNESVQLKKAEPKFIDIITKARGYRFAAKDVEERDEWIEALAKFATLEVVAPVAEQAEAEAEAEAETETPAQASEETVETAEGPSEAITAEASTEAVAPVVDEKTAEPATTETPAVAQAQA